MFLLQKAQDCTPHLCIPPNFRDTFILPYSGWRWQQKIRHYASDSQRLFLSLPMFIMHDGTEKEVCPMHPAPLLLGFGLLVAMLPFKHCQSLCDLLGVLPLSFKEGKSNAFISCPNSATSTSCTTSFSIQSSSYFDWDYAGEQGELVATCFLSWLFLLILGGKMVGFFSLEHGVYLF